MSRLLEKGFSLIEFMIAIAISMIVLLAVSIAWQSGFAMQQAQTDSGRLNETVRFAIDLLSREIKQAGLINPVTYPPEPNFCSTKSNQSGIAGINDPASGLPSIDPTKTGINFAGNAITIANLSDAIRVRYYGDDSAAGGIAGATGLSTDCLGNTIPSRTLVEDTLYVAIDPNNSNEPALWCHTSNPTSAAVSSQPIVSGVESLQILYGEDTDTPPDGIINRYVPAQLVTNFDNVLSVKVSIVARSANAVTTDSTVAKNYYHFGATYADPGGTIGTQVCVSPSLALPNPQCATATQVVIQNDSRLRLPQPVSTEIAIRNFSNCSMAY